MEKMTMKRAVGFYFHFAMPIPAKPVTKRIQTARLGADRTNISPSRSGEKK